MSQNESEEPEEPDPLLGFEMEAIAPVPPAVPEEPVVQAAVTREDPSPPLPPSPSSIELQSAVERVDRIERALEQSNMELEQSKMEVVSLKSEVATLVGAMADLKIQMSRRPAPSVDAVSPARLSWPRTASAIAAAIFGLSAGVFGWLYWTNTDATVGAPAIEQASIAPANATPAPAEMGTAAAPVAPAPARVQVAAPARARVAPPERAEADEPEEAQSGAFGPVTYFGTLSIDAAPGGNVSVDRKSVGRTPLRVANLRAGSHLIWVERDGYRRWTRVVQVPANRVSRVSAELEPIASR